MKALIAALALVSLSGPSFAAFQPGPNYYNRSPAKDQARAAVVSMKPGATMLTANLDTVIAKKNVLGAA